MIIGDKKRFAIEFDLDAAKLGDDVLKEWKFGCLCWWCGGEQVGRYEADTTLRDLSIEAVRILADENKRQDAILMSAPREVVVRAIVDALFEDHGQSDEQVELDEERYRRFVVKPEVDVFDGWDIFLIEGKSARLIWRRVKGGGVGEVELAPGEFDAILRSFVAALDVAAQNAPRT